MGLNQPASETTMKYLPLMILMSALAAPLSGAGAQEIGTLREGDNLAHMVCAECHMVDKGAAPAARNQAPNFETLANTRGMNAQALRVALRTSHMRMPNLMLTEDQRESVITYILSLKGE
jgi:mono/diheme cytochrome c family protein